MGQKASVEAVEKKKITAFSRNHVLNTKFFCLYPVLSEQPCLHTSKNNEE